MLKDRLYYRDSYCKAFTSTVVVAAEDHAGNPFVILENTAFYPTGGGQPNDIGTLNGIAVIDVQEVDGEIRHLLAEKIVVSTTVEGVIDWSRRFDHMQQHAGQHILSASFVELFGFNTVNFHLGQDTVSIDVDVDYLSPSQLADAEKLANSVILENRPIETKWVHEAELDQYALRKKLAVTDEIRLVIIPDFDDNGCGGTHPHSTGQVRAIKILFVEKEKKKMRIHFVCGERVLHQLHTTNSIVSKASKLLSIPSDGVVQSIEKLLGSTHTLEKTVTDMNEKLLNFEAQHLLELHGNTRITATFSNRPVYDLQKLAKLLTAENDSIIILFVNDNVDKLQFVAACGTDVTVSMKSITSTILPVINGKGGGSDTFAQGGGEKTLSSKALLLKMTALLDS